MKAVLSSKLVMRVLTDTVVTSLKVFIFFYFYICLNIAKTRQFRSQYNSCQDEL
jgi:hypothetical protein